MKKKSILLTLTAVMLALGVGIGGTIAYFTAKTDAVVNTFTTGNITLKLDEGKVEPDGDGWVIDEEADRVQKNDYGQIYPGAHLPKDPTFHVGGVSDSYLAAKIVVTNGTKWAALMAGYDLGDGQIVEGFDEDAWTITKTVDTTAGVDTITYFLVYNTKITADDDGTDVVLFRALNIPEGLEEVADLEIAITGYAVQAQGLTLAEAAAELNDLAFPAPPAV